jgi:hypothetical protein
MPIQCVRSMSKGLRPPENRGNIADTAPHKKGGSDSPLSFNANTYQSSKEPDRSLRRFTIEILIRKQKRKTVKHEEAFICLHGFASLHQKAPRGEGEEPIVVVISPKAPLVRKQLVYSWCGP